MCRTSALSKASCPAHTSQRTTAFFIHTWRACDGRCSTTLQSSGSRRTPHLGSLSNGVCVAASSTWVRSGVPAIAGNLQIMVYEMATALSVPVLLLIRSYHGTPSGVSEAVESWNSFPPPPL